MKIENGTKIEIRENYKHFYKIFGNKGTVKKQVTTCQQIQSNLRPEYYDVEVVSTLTKRVEIQPILKTHVKPCETGIFQAG